MKTSPEEQVRGLYESTAHDGDKTETPLYQDEALIRERDLAEELKCEGCTVLGGH